MNVKSGIDQIGILVGDGFTGINSVIHAILRDTRDHRAVVGIYDGFKHLIEENLVGISQTGEAMRYIHSEGDLILRLAQPNARKSNDHVSSDRNNRIYAALQLAPYAKELMERASSGAVSIKSPVWLETIHVGLFHNNRVQSENL